MRRGLRDLAEKLVVGSGLTGRLTAARGGRRIVLAYHNIIPEGETAWAQATLHLRAEEFRRQLDLLADTFDVVPLPELMTSVGPLDRPLAAVTIDDAYRGAVTAGIRHLAELRMPVTVFVPPGLLGGHSFWWDRLEIDLDGDLRERALNDHRGEQSRVDAWAGAQNLRARALPAHAHSATLEELDEALAMHPGLSLGSHTWSHPNLPALTRTELASELETPLPWLMARFPGRASAWLAYPYGEAGPRERAAAMAAGYAGACLVRGGWLRTSSNDPHWTPRLNIPSGLSIRGFAVRMAGLLCR